VKGIYWRDESPGDLLCGRRCCIPSRKPSSQTKQMGWEKTLKQVSTLLGALILVAAVLMAAGQDQPMRIGVIDFYGYAGLDVDQIRSRLPLKEGDAISNPRALTDAVNKVVKSITGRPATDVEPVCCDPQGNWMIYVGLPGTSVVPAKFNPVPKGKFHFAPDIVELYNQTMEASSSAILKGNSSEDHSQGFALSSEPALRAKQLEVHTYASEHDKLILQVLNSSSDARQRAVAAFMLGYGRRSQQQISALVHASHDADDTVRNNATRALAVLADSNPKVAARIPASGFIRMLSSPSWTDRNKAGFLLMYLTRTRDPKLLRQIHAEALTPLIEIARWKDHAHALSARVLLGRIAGIPDERLVELANADNAEEIIKELKLKSHAPE
jgi:hypothetical protein